MSVRVRGTINIQRKSGRKGDFNIGDLSTEIGTFEVKDALIEQFEPGKYTGDFIIQWIEPDSFSWRGRVFVKNRATLVEILVDEADEGAPPPATPPEPDPIDSDVHQQAQLVGKSNAATTSAGRTDPPPATAPTGSAAPSPDADGGSADGKLFGAEIHSLVVTRSAVKMDPTVDRELFRQQRDRLKALGYTFNAVFQTWHHKDSHKHDSETDRMALDIPF